MRKSSDIMSYNMESLIIFSVLIIFVLSVCSCICGFRDARNMREQNDIELDWQEEID